jgi:hypothetical protein
LVRVPPGIMKASPAIIDEPGIWVIPAGLKAMAEGSSARPTMAPPRAFPLALQS